MRDQAGGDYVWFVDLGAVSVVLNDREHGRKSAVGNEDDANPMVNNAVGEWNAFAV